MANKLTPRFKTVKLENLYKFISIDIGLWPGKTGKNTMNIMPYYQGDKKWYPIATDLEGIKLVYKECESLWQKYSCPNCNGKGCKECDQSGWKDYKNWKESGEKIDKNNYAL